MFLKLFCEFRFESVCLTCQVVFKGPRAPPVPTLSPVSQTVGSHFLFLNICPSATFLSFPFFLFPSCTWSTRLAKRKNNCWQRKWSQNTVAGKFKGYWHLHSLLPSDVLVLLCTFTCEIKEGGRISLISLGSIFGFERMRQNRRDNSLLTSIVGVIAAAGVPASLHPHPSAELWRRDTSQTRQKFKLQKELMTACTAVMKTTEHLGIK